MSDVSHLRPTWPWPHIIQPPREAWHLEPEHQQSCSAVENGMLWSWGKVPAYGLELDLWYAAAPAPAPAPPLPTRCACGHINEHVLPEHVIDGEYICGSCRR
jgi:hypothetical protein